MTGWRGVPRPLIVLPVVAGVALILYASGLGRKTPAPAPRVAERPVPATRGAQVFENWCASCHARGPGHPGTQSLEVKYKGSPPAALEDRTDLSPDVTAHYVRNGVALMPFFRKTEISDADLRELSAYLAKKK